MTCIYEYIQFSLDMSQSDIYYIIIFKIKKFFIYFKDTYSTNLAVDQPVLYEILKNDTKLKKILFSFD
jgi:hypothetical protein